MFLERFPDMQIPQQLVFDIISANWNTVIRTDIVSVSWKNIAKLLLWVGWGGGGYRCSLFDKPV